MEKQRFLRYVNVENERDALKNTIKAALQHNKTYVKGISPNHRAKFVNSFKEEIAKVAKPYKNNPISEKLHIENICKIKEQMSEQYGNILINSTLRIGTAQKALNLYLKFLWCLGEIEYIPPHCPIDYEILKKAGIKDSWTKCDSINQYIKWIDEIKKVANQDSYDSIQIWELAVWNLKNNYQ